MPFRPGELWPDNNGVHINAHGGGILLVGDTYYWFGEHKVAGEQGNAAHVGVHVYASADLLHWTDRGIALAVSPAADSEIQAGCIIERPKVLRSRSTGKFVMWFHLEPTGMGYGGAKVGVAVSDQPAGPYAFVRSFRPNRGHWPANTIAADQRPNTAAETELLASLNLTGGPVPGYPDGPIYRRDFAGGQMSRDMTLFEDDDDGAAWHLASSEDNGTLHLSRLTADLLDTTGYYLRLFPGEFNEAPALFKHSGRYFLFASGCTGWNPNPARLYSANHLEGPWTSLGNPCIGTPEQCATTFESQPTFVLQSPRGDGYIFLADRWRPSNAIDGRYVWLPIRFSSDSNPVLYWQSSWDLPIFKKPSGKL